MSGLPVEALHPRFLLNQRLCRSPRVGSRVVDARIEELTAQGRDIIQLRPYPSRRLPQQVLQAIDAASREAVNPPSRGILEFRIAVSTALHNELGVSLDPEANVLATAGGMHALFLVFLALLNPDDEVLVPAPCYFVEGLVQSVGGRVVYVPMQESDEFRWDVQRLESYVTKRTKCMFVNTPANPTGYVLTQSDLRQLAEVAERHGIFIIADESYNTLVYDGRRHLSIAALPEAIDRTILVRSFTKSFAMPGWRVGYIAASRELIESFTKALEWTALYGAYVNQKAAAAVLCSSQDWIAGATDEFQRARDFLFTGIEQIPGMYCGKPGGGPFMFVNVARLGTDGDEFSSVLLENFGVPTTPGSFLQSRDHVRIAFGAEQAALDVVLRRLRAAAESLRPTGSRLGFEPGGNT